MTSYLKQSKDSLAAQQKQLQQEYDAACAKGLKLDMSRGKPSPTQLALSEGMLTIIKTSAETTLVINSTTIFAPIGKKVTISINNILLIKFFIKNTPLSNILLRLLEKSVDLLYNK